MCFIMTFKNTYFVLIHADPTTAIAMSHTTVPAFLFPVPFSTPEPLFPSKLTPSITPIPLPCLIKVSSSRKLSFSPLIFLFFLHFVFWFL